MSRSLSTGREAQCQDSVLTCWTDIILYAWHYIFFHWFLYSITIVISVLYSVSSPSLYFLSFLLFLRAACDAHIVVSPNEMIQLLIIVIQVVQVVSGHTAGYISSTRPWCTDSMHTVIIEIIPKIILVFPVLLLLLHFYLLGPLTLCLPYCVYAVVLVSW